MPIRFRLAASFVALLLLALVLSACSGSGQVDESAERSPAGQGEGAADELVALLQRRGGTHERF